MITAQNYSFSEKKFLSMLLENLFKKKKLKKILR